MKGGKLVHRTVSPQQAAILRLAIANYRKAKKLMKAWEDETERLLDLEATHKSYFLSLKCPKRPQSALGNYVDIRSATCGM